MIFLLDFLLFLSIGVLLLMESLGVQTVASELVDRLRSKKTKFHSLGTQQGLYVSSQIL